MRSFVSPAASAAHRIFTARSTMTELPTGASWVTRLQVFRFAWLLLLVSLMIPVRGGSGTTSFTLSAVHVVHRALAWDGALTGDADHLGAAQSAVLCLALFANLRLHSFGVHAHLGRRQRTWARVADPTEIAASHALNGYVNDRANVLTRDQVA